MIRVIGAFSDPTLRDGFASAPSPLSTDCGSLFKETNVTFSRHQANKFDLHKIYTTVKKKASG